MGYDEEQEMILSGYHPPMTCDERQDMICASDEEQDMQTQPHRGNTGPQEDPKGLTASGDGGHDTQGNRTHEVSKAQQPHRGSTEPMKDSGNHSPRERDERHKTISDPPQGPRQGT